MMNYIFIVCMICFSVLEAMEEGATLLSVNIDPSYELTEDNVWSELNSALQNRDEQRKRKCMKFLKEQERNRASLCSGNCCTATHNALRYVEPPYDDLETEVAELRNVGRYEKDNILKELKDARWDINYCNSMKISCGCLCLLTSLTVAGLLSGLLR